MIPEDYERLRQERDMAEQYLNISGAIILSLDLSGRVCLLNKAGERILGYAQDEILGKSWFDLAIPESQREQAKNEFQALIAEGRKTADLSTADPIENEVLSKSGDHLYVRWNEAVMRDVQGNAVSVLISGIDLTQKKHIETALRQTTERLRDFSDAASDWLWEMGPDLRFTDLSPALTRILGTSADEMLGTSRADCGGSAALRPQPRASKERKL